MMKRAGCAMLMPSRSTVFTPLAALSSTTSTRPSSSRFTSSTYRMPRFAFAYATVPTVLVRSAILERCPIHGFR